MKTFNNSDLFTGYIKQLLHSFHLPKIRIYTKQHSAYFLKHGVERADILETVEATLDDKTTIAGAKRLSPTPIKNVRYCPYIKDGMIQEYVNHNWQNINQNDKGYTPLAKYAYGDKILNYTKNLQIKSNTYDSYTHEYLGDYLRFHRDFLNLDLMPLYNCFSNRVCDKLDIQWVQKLVSEEEEQLDRSQIISFNSTDPNFKIYMLPIKLFQKYTIAIDSELPIELCCGVYGDYQDSRKKFVTLPKNTYKRVAKSVFSQPFLYDALAYLDNNTNYLDSLLGSQVDTTGTNTLIELAQNEGDLKLFLKVPKYNTSTIVVLEGDYRTWNNSIWQPSGAGRTTKNYLKQTNKTVINLQPLPSTAQVPLITPLQLLRSNTREQHPFADRLIEYLIGNAITNSETEIYDNIRRAQKALASNSLKNHYRTGIPGVWSENMQLIFYEYMTRFLGSKQLTQHNFEINHDILGYVDKEVEKFYQAIINGTEISLLNIELEEGDK